MRKPVNPHVGGPGSDADPQLRAETFEVASRLRSTLLLQRETRRWQYAVIGSIIWFALSLLVIGQPQFTAVGILGIIAYVLYLNWKDSKSTPIDFVAAAERSKKRTTSNKHYQQRSKPSDGADWIFFKPDSSMRSSTIRPKMIGNPQS